MGWLYVLALFWPVFLLPLIALVATLVALAPDLPRARARYRCRR